MTLPYYHGLLRDTRRIEAFRRAINEVVEDGDVVLEIGTGLGTYAFFAADAGAARVHAVDGSPILHVAEAVGRHNGYDARICWHRGWIPQVELGEKVDVLVFEDFSTRLLDAENYRVLADAYSKYLKPGGRVIPGRARLMLAPVSHAELWKNQIPIPRTDAQAFGIDWTPSLEYAENTPGTASLGADALVGEPVEIAAFPLRPLPSAAAMGGRGSWRIDPGTKVHGLALWFDIEISDGLWVCNTPGPDCGAWGQVFLPSNAPIEFAQAGVLEATISVHRFADGAPGWLRWSMEWPEGSLTGDEFGSDPASLEDLLRDATTPSPRDGAQQDVAPQVTVRR